jgi:polar amino acid transport system permease protein
MLDILRDNWLLFLIGQYPNGPLGGLALTLILATLGIGLSFPCAIALALARLSPYRLVRYPATALIQAVRGLPLLMFIFWAYFFLPVVTGKAISGFTTLLCALVIYESAYLAEIIRSGIQALPSGQMAAARSLGLGYFGAMRRVVLPQVLYNVLPSMLSQFISTIKETSLGYVISVHELTFAASQVNNMLLTKPAQVYGILALTYFLVCVGLTQAARQLETRIARRRAGMAATASRTLRVVPAAAASNI